MVMIYYKNYIQLFIVSILNVCYNIYKIIFIETKIYIININNITKYIQNNIKIYI